MILKEGQFICDCCCNVCDEEDDCEPGYGLCNYCNDNLREEEEMDKENRDKWQG